MSKLDNKYKEINTSYNPIYSNNKKSPEIIKYQFNQIHVQLITWIYT